MNKLEILAVGDQHFKTDNIEEVDIFISKITELALSKNPNIIILLGDLLHTHEKIHCSPLNKAYEFIDKMRKIAKTYILVGNHDMCFGFNTPILMYDTTVRMIQDIRVGDIVLGDDYNPRIVSHITSGESEMYLVEQSIGDDYIVNENHTLCLVDNATLNIVDITVRDYIQLHDDIKRSLSGYKSYKSKESISRIYNTVFVSNIGIQKYYGFSTNENHKFLLPDCTVVHNCNNSQFLTENHWLNGLKAWDNVSIIDKVVKENINGFDLTFVPYVYPGRFVEALNSLGDDSWKNCDCIFAHQEFYGCKMGSIISEEGDKWLETYPQVVSGHIHTNHKVQNNIYYPGSAMQNAFGDKGKNIIPYLQFVKKGEYILDEIDLGLSRKYIVYFDNIKEVEDYVIKEDKDEDKVEDKVKISISGSMEEFKVFKKTKKYKELTDKNIKIVFKHTRKEITERNSMINELINEQNMNSESNFESILENIILRENNKLLYEDYTSVIRR